jgi:cellobiose transport system substrate-binding protein
MIAFPMDTGPTALYYRADLFQKASLPTDPAAVSAKLATWDNFLNAAEQMKQATNGKVYLTDSMYSIFSEILGQIGKGYFDPSGHYIGNQEHVKQAWDTAIKFHQMGLSPAIDSPPATDWNASISSGTIAAFVGAVWEQKYLMQAGPETTGRWRVARAPGGDGNNGGSFIGITKYSQHAKEAFEIIKWLQSPQNQLRSFLNENLFPSTPGVFSNSKMVDHAPFFGGENITAIFTQAAAHVKPTYFDPQNNLVDTIFKAELQNVDALNKDPNTAWNDAQREIQRELSV